jgi:class 3 adenylate cyclase/tetratricopeptide (TPR) repeat protein
MPMAASVEQWLQERGLAECAEALAFARVDLATLPRLTDEHLREIGLPVGLRLRLMAALEPLARAVPANAALDASNETAVEAAVERRRLTVVFADLVGSTPLATQMDPEDLRELIRAFHLAIDIEAARGEGFVAQYKGDGALVYFGYPRAHEDDAERAVRAALAMTRAVARLRTPAGQPLAAHVGVATGLAVVGDTFGHRGARERSAIGETPNLAARLVDLAGPGQVVISEQTWQLARHQFACEPLGAHAIRGLPEPVAVYRVDDERRTETRFDARQSGTPQAMVGRDRELATLRALWDQAAAGRGQVVLISGEAGIGKSRLVRALDTALAGQAHGRISNQCVQHHAGSALYPMARQIARAAGLMPGDDAPQQLAKLRRLLRDADDTAFALTARLLGIDAPLPATLAALTPSEQRALTFRALVAHFERSTHDGPVLWLLEDAHWIDPTTRELVQLCIERVAALPVLAIVTFRPEFQHPFGQPPHLHHLVLERLAPADAAALVRRLCQGLPLTDEVLGRIVARTDGVPLFVEEFTRSLLESGALSPATGAADAAPAAQQLAVPASLHDSLMSRLDRHRALKEVAQIAACIGREFGHDLLERVAGLPAAMLQSALEQLQDAELVFRKSPAERRLYVFKHALVRDAAYESLLRRRREELHARILAALQPAPDAPAELLAHHAAAAGMADRAIELWARASASALARSAFAEAVTHLDEALALNASLPAGPARDSQRLDLLLALGQATIPLRGYSHSRSVEVFAQAAALAQALGDGQRGFWVAYARWVVHYVRGEHATAQAIAQAMLDQAAHEAHAGRVLTAQRALGISQMISGDPCQADRTFTQAEQLAEQVRRQPRDRRMAAAQRFAADPEIATQFHVALTHWALGRTGRARALAAHSVEAARTMGHVHTLGHALAHGAIVAVVDRDPLPAIAWCEEAAELSTRHDMDLWLGYGSILQGFARALAGEFDAAVAHLDSGLGRLERTETGTMVPVHHAVCAWALAQLGRFDAARRHLALVDTELQQGSERYFWIDALVFRGHCQLLLPESSRQAAEADYERARREAQRQGALAWELRAALALGQSWRDRGHTASIDGLLQPLLQRLPEGEGSTLAHEARQLCAAAARVA